MSQYQLFCRHPINRICLFLHNIFTEIKNIIKQHLHWSQPLYMFQNCELKTTQVLLNTGFNFNENMWLTSRNGFITEKLADFLYWILFTLLQMITEFRIKYCSRLSWRLHFDSNKITLFRVKSFPCRMESNGIFLLMESNGIFFFFKTDCQKSTFVPWIFHETGALKQLWALHRV